MYKDATYKEKYAALSDWFPFIVETIKRDLKNEHLKKDLAFVKTYLPSKNANKATTEEIAQAYSQAIAEAENDEYAEFVTSRWLLKNTDIYDFFERNLKQVTQDFTSLKELDSAVSQKMMNESIQQFGAPSTYLFAVLNSVVFPADIFKQLKQHAEKETQQKKESEAVGKEKLTLENAQRVYERDVARITEKYEKKLAGLEKKYVTDVENLKKQVSALQRKLNQQ